MGNNLRTRPPSRSPWWVYILLAGLVVFACAHISKGLGGQ